MARQFSKTAVGGFVIGGIALLFASIIVFGGGNFFKETKKFVIFFEGSVKGLQKGASVVFRGVEIGNVSEIILEANTDLSVQIPVVIEIDPNRFRNKDKAERKLSPSKVLEILVKKGLRARLTMQSLVTGQLIIEFDFFPDTPVKLRGTDLPYPEIPSKPSSLDQLVKQVEKLPITEIAEKLLEAVQTVENILKDSRLDHTLQTLNRVMKNAEQMVENADGLMTDTRAFVGDLHGQVDPIAGDIRKTVNHADQFMVNLDNRITPAASEVLLAVKDARKLIGEGRQAVTSIDSLVGGNSEVRYHLNRSLAELSSTLQSLRELTDYLERHPEALLQGKSNSDRR